MKHLTEEQLSGYVSDSLGASKANEVGRHLLQCENCRSLLPAPTPQLFLSALFGETEDQYQDFLQASASKQPFISVIFSPFFKGRGLAWSAGALILAASFSFLLWETAIKQPNITTELAKTDSIEANSSNTSVDKSLSNSMTEKSVITQDEKKPALAVTSTKKLDKSPSFAVNEVKSVKKLEEIELAQITEKIPAVVLSLRSNDSAVLRTNSDNTEAKKTFQLINPVGETVIETAPEFHWEKSADAESYRITIFDADFNEVLTEEVSENRFKPDQSLKPGTKYLWRVAAQTESGEVIAPRLPQPPAMFRVAPKNAGSQIESYKKDKDAQFKLALFYARAGMLDLAHCTLKWILTKNSKHRAANRLLVKVEQWRKENKIGVQRCGLESSRAGKSNE